MRKKIKKKYSQNISQYFLNFPQNFNTNAITTSLINSPLSMSSFACLKPNGIIALIFNNLILSSVNDFPFKALLNSFKNTKKHFLSS